MQWAAPYGNSFPFETKQSSITIVHLSLENAYTTTNARGRLVQDVPSDVVRIAR
jgi:hypothetical protein